MTAATTFEQQSLIMSDVRQTKAALVRVRAEENLNAMGKAYKDLAYGLAGLGENEPYMDRQRQWRNCSESFRDP